MYFYKITVQHQCSIAICCIGLIGLLRRKFRRLTMSAAKGRKHERGSQVPPGFDAHYKALNLTSDEEDG